MTVSFRAIPGRSVTVNELADTVGTVLGTEVRKEYLPERPGEIMQSWADISAARELLGWEPAIDLEKGLRLTAASLVR